MVTSTPHVFNIGKTDSLKRQATLNLSSSIDSSANSMGLRLSSNIYSVPNLNGRMIAPRNNFLQGRLGIGSISNLIDIEFNRLAN